MPEPIQAFGQNEDTPDVATARWETTRKNFHDWIDDFPGISDRERVERKASFDETWRANLAASGLKPSAPKSEDQRAAEAIEQRFAVSPIGENLAASLVAELARIEAAKHEHLAMRAELARHYRSESEYAQILREAALGAGAPLTDAQKLSRHWLDVYAVRGRAAAGRAAALANRRISS